MFYNLKATMDTLKADDKPLLTRSKQSLPHFPSIDEDSLVFMTQREFGGSPMVIQREKANTSVCASRQLRHVSTEKVPKIADPRKSHIERNPDFTSTPVSLAPMVAPYRRIDDLPPVMPWLSNLQAEDDFHRPSLQCNSQTRVSTRICRPSLIPRSEVKRSKKRKSEDASRSLLLEPRFLVVERDSLVDDIKYKLADFEIDLPSMKPDGVTLKQRCRSLKPRKP